MKREKWDIFENQYLLWLYGFSVFSTVFPVVLMGDVVPFIIDSGEYLALILVWITTASVSLVLTLIAIWQLIRDELRGNYNDAED